MDGDVLIAAMQIVFMVLLLVYILLIHLLLSDNDKNSKEIIYNNFAIPIKTTVARNMSIQRSNVVISGVSTIKA